MDELLLREQLQDPDLGVRIKAVLALRALPAAQAVPLLEIVLADRNTRVRYSAVSMLGQKATPVTRELLTRCLAEDPEFDIRAAAAASLGDLGEKEAFTDLVAAYDRDREPMVRFSIVAALGELGDPRAFDLLQTALTQGDLQEEAALMALGQLALPESIPILTRYLTHADWQLRLRAVQALGTMGQTEPLKTLQEDHPQVQQAITTALS